MRSIKLEYPFVIKSFFSRFFYRWDSNFYFGGEMHDAWEFICILDGEVEVVEDDKVYNLSSGNFIAHAPMQFHRIKSIGNTKPRVLIVSFCVEGTLPKKITDGIFFLNPSEIEELKNIVLDLMYYLRNDGDKKFDANQLEALNQIQDRPPVDDDEVIRDRTLEVAIRLTLFIMNLTNNHSPRVIYSSSKSAPDYRNFVNIMQSHIYENLSLEEIASMGAMSVSSLKKLFKKYAAIGPKTYYSNLRANEAMNLLASGHSVEEVSEKLNFSSVSYFSLFFKKHFGSPPSFYKQ